MKKLNFTTKKLVTVALLAAISVLLNTFDIVLAGGTLKLTFSYLPAMVAGIFFGPAAGFLVGFLGDSIGILVNPQTGWLAPISFASGLIGLIPGVVFKIPKLHPFAKIPLAYVLVFLVCTIGINSPTTFYLYLIPKGTTKSFIAFLIGRLPMQAVCLAVNMAITILIYKPLEKYILKAYGTSNIHPKAKRPAPSDEESANQ